MPKPVEILLELMRDMPTVRKRLLVSHEDHDVKNTRKRAA
jgi:hypothetical protein